MCLDIGRTSGGPREDLWIPNFVWAIPEPVFSGVAQPLMEGTLKHAAPLPVEK